MRHMLGTYLNMQERDVDTLGHSQEKVKCVPKHIPVAANLIVSRYVEKYFSRASFCHIRLVLHVCYIDIREEI